ncbi:hypothetical protein LEP3755_09660 [Leptolyngbya sp. NIES-3755]|nr:hypothetical protein LEP3755_09660 [Leptolyngbya sp. NIES-3755]
MKLNHFWNAVVSRISSSGELQVNHRRDYQGNWSYQIYDPQAEKHNTFGTEQEVRMWLDQRHYD